MEDEDVLTDTIKKTIDYVTQLDKQELSDLIMELRDAVGEEFLDNVFELELLAVVTYDRRTKAKVGSISCINVETIASKDAIG